MLGKLRHSSCELSAVIAGPKDQVPCFRSAPRLCFAGGSGAAGACELCAWELHGDMDS